MDINNQKLIYFNSPRGTGERIHYNLWAMGLDKNKKICHCGIGTIFHETMNNRLIEKFKVYDVIYLDGFYEWELTESKTYDHGIAEGDVVMKETIRGIQELVEYGKQVVMASHDNFHSFTRIPKEFKEKVVVYDLDYSIKWSFDLKPVE